MKFDYVTVIPNCLPKKTIEFLLSLKTEKTSLATTMGCCNEQSTNLDYRITNWIPLPPNITQNTIESITNLYYTKLISIYKQTIKHVEPTQFLYYNVGGKYDIHNDSEDFENGKLKRVSERDVSILIYLNDDYKGGELEFPDWGVSFKPKAGTLIAFPSYIEFSHKVHPVTEGERFNLVSWICTNDRIYPRPYEQNEIRTTWVLSPG